MRVTESFNPYQTWLGLEPSLDRPDLYRLLGLNSLEPDPQRIAAAADRAMSRVRAQRPGGRAAEWARLLDELKAAKKYLTDPSRKADYDAALQRGEPFELPIRDVEPESEGVIAERCPEVPSDSSEPDLPLPDPAVEIPSEAASDDVDDFEAAIAASLMLPRQVTTPADAPATRPDAAAATGSPATPAPGPMVAPLNRTQQTPAADPMAPYDPGAVASAAAAAPTANVSPRPPRRNNSNQAALVVSGISLVVLLFVILGAYYFIKQDDWLAATSPDPTLASARPADPPTATRPRATTTPAPNARLDSSGERKPVPPTPAIEMGLDDEPAETSEPLELDADMAEMETPADAPAAAPTSPLVVADSVPESAPASASAAAMPQPTAEQLQQLGAALTAARTALAEQRFEEARTSLASARELAVLEEHQNMVARLNKLAGYAEQFQQAVTRGMRSLEAGATFMLTDGEPVVVVERMADAIKIRWKGQNLDFELKKLPISIGIPLARLGLDDSPESKVITGAFQALHRRATPEHLDEVRGWWTEAAAEGADVADLLPVLDDRYDFATTDAE